MAIRLCYIFTYWSAFNKDKDISFFLLCFRTHLFPIVIILLREPQPRGLLTGWRKRVLNRVSEDLCMLYYINPNHTGEIKVAQ